jgi:hypothetical protein
MAKREKLKDRKLASTKAPIFKPSLHKTPILKPIKQEEIKRIEKVWWSDAYQSAVAEVFTGNCTRVY